MTAPPRDNHPRERLTDTRWGKVLVFWRNVIPLIALALAFIAITGTESEQDRQRTGRRVAIEVLCGLGNGVASAGRMTLEASADIKPDRFEAALERLGMFPAATRKSNAERAATAYATIIGKSIRDTAHVDRGVIEPDGTVDCAALVDAARAEAR